MVTGLQVAVPAGAQAAVSKKMSRKKMKNFNFVKCQEKKEKRKKRSDLAFLNKMILKKIIDREN